MFCMTRACFIVHEERTQALIVACKGALVHTHVVFVKEQLDAVTDEIRHWICFC